MIIFVLLKSGVPVLKSLINFTQNFRKIWLRPKDGLIILIFLMDTSSPFFTFLII